jgi:hypothetical protein
MKLLIKLCILFYFYVDCVKAWGPIGHNLTAKIAYELLNDNSKEMLKNYSSIRNEYEFESLANWADNIKNTKEYSWSYNLHFCDIYSPVLERCQINYTLDCVDERCIISAINNFTNNLRENFYDKDSLSFIIHFLGDIFQPFHIGYLDDLGGNKIRVKFDNISTNLHAVWDEHIINKNIKELGSVELFEKDIKKYLKIITLSYPLDPLYFAQNSLNILCHQGLYFDNGELIKNNHNLTNFYYYFNLSVIKSRIALGAYYLSEIINNIYGNNNY